MLCWLRSGPLSTNIFIFPCAWLRPQPCRFAKRSFLLFASPHLLPASRREEPFVSNKLCFAFNPIRSNPAIRSILRRHSSWSWRTCRTCPAWKNTLSGQKIWKLVTFLSHMDKLPSAVEDEWQKPGFSPGDDHGSNAGKAPGISPQRKTEGEKHE